MIIKDPLALTVSDIGRELLSLRQEMLAEDSLNMRETLPLWVQISPSFWQSEAMKEISSRIHI